MFLEELEVMDPYTFCKFLDTLGLLHKYAKCPLLSKIATKREGLYDLAERLEHRRQDFGPEWDDEPTEDEDRPVLVWSGSSESSSGESENEESE